MSEADDFFRDFLLAFEFGHKLFAEHPFDAEPLGDGERHGDDGHDREQGIKRQRRSAQLAPVHIEAPYGQEQDPQLRDPERAARRQFMGLQTPYTGIEELNGRGIFF